MLRNYAIPVTQGLLVFIALAALLWLPYVIWLYRRYGRVSPRRIVAQGGFLLYLLCAWALVLLPFPSPAIPRQPAPVNLVPFLWW
jgi:glycopeptide antibiotics resistance protein